MSTRSIEIDSLRGIACIFLVAYHTIGADAGNGLRIEDGLYRQINDVLVYIRMPLFTFLSGIVYAYRPYRGETKRFIVGKFRRLIIPMLVVGTAFAVIQALTPWSNDAGKTINWSMLHIFPVAHFWFIESLFIIFLLMIPAETIGVFERKSFFIILFLMAVALYISNYSIHYFSIYGAIYLLPYFLLGVLTQRYNLSRYFTRKHGFVLSLLLIIILAAIAMGYLPEYYNRSFPALLISILACFTLLSLKIKSSLLGKIGLFSYSIYLYHVFFTASGRILLTKLGITDINLLFIVCLSLGIFIPILVEKICDKTPVTRVLFLGKSPKNNGLTPQNK